MLATTLLAFQATGKNWQIDSVPNPVQDVEDCNLSAPGWVCDPDHTLTRENMDVLASVLGGSEHEVPHLALVVMEPDDSKDFGVLDRQACNIRNNWLHKLHLFDHDDTEMQLLVKKGKLVMICSTGNFTDGGQKQMRKISKADTPEELANALLDILPEITVLVDQARDKGRATRAWHHMESCAAGVVVFLGTAYLMYIRNRQKQKPALYL